MRLLLIPSWFPSKTMPMAGRFVQDQAQALQRHAQPMQLAVASWGHHDGALSLREPQRSARAMRWRLTQSASARWQAHDGLDCAFSPALSWTLNWRGGGVRGQLAACRRALQLALQRWGSVDLLHAHVCFPGGWIARQLSSEFDIPYVLTEHMGPFPFPALRARDGALDARLAPVFDDAAAVLAVSPTLAQAIRAEGLRCDGVVPNVVDVQRFAAASASEAPRPASPWVLLALGGLHRVKGFDLLLQALQRWNPPWGSVELRIGGDGPERAALQAQTRALGLEDRVRWLGGLHPDQVPQALAQAHALVSASRHETFGVVLAEALAAGRPVLATRSGGPESVVHDGVGRMVATDDVPALAEGLAWLHQHSADFDPKALRQDALQRFGPAAVASQLQAVYARVLAQRGTR
ncbi:MAG: glycosyltransferase [Burkholderiaceae bacterium]|nr:glycosyltransferase [Burkholderiaceae bacterium]